MSIQYGHVAQSDGKALLSQNFHSLEFDLKSFLQSSSLSYSLNQMDMEADISFNI